MLNPAPIVREVRHFHFCCGLAGAAKGFNRGSARVGNMTAQFRCIGGVDNDPASIRDFTRAAGVPGTVVDLFSLEQYIAFHGRMPPAGWREAGPDDIRRAAGGERPHIVFISAPCKGFSGLLSEALSKSERYQALNKLTERCVFLMLEAWSDDPPELIVFENVPRIQKRGRQLINRIIAMLRAYGYAVEETQHDCGELGGLAQSRKRYLLVARHIAKVPAFLYEPVKKRLRGVGEVLDKLPVPGCGLGGPMHRVPSLQWKTWVRLAFVEAGSDWRSLNRLRVEDGMLADYAIKPGCEWRRGVLGVGRWEDHSYTVAGENRPTNGAFSIADPRWHDAKGAYGQYGVRNWPETGGAVTGQRSPGQGGFSVADMRMPGPPRFNNIYRVIRRDQSSQAVTGGGSPTAGGLAVADARPPAGSHASKYRVTRRDEPSGAVIAASTTGQGAFALADPRPGWGDGAHPSKLAVQEYEETARTVTGARVQSGALCVADPRYHGKNDTYQTSGNYGVVAYEGTAGAVAAAGQHDNGHWSVADPRGGHAEAPAALPEMGDRLIAVIQAEDNTWHRPFTTLELAALQSLVDPEEFLVLDGMSDSTWRERIGNAVPPDSAQAIASECGRTLLLAWAGETFMLSNAPIWVQPLAIALSVQRPDLMMEENGHG